MLLEDAKRLIENGQAYSIVFPVLDEEDRERFKAWYAKRPVARQGVAFPAPAGEKVAKTIPPPKEWEQNAGDWGSLPDEPCRHCHKVNCVYFRADDSPFDRNMSQVVRCNACGRNWECTSTST